VSRGRAGVLRSDRPLLEGRFVARRKRFFADVEFDDGRVVAVHCPNSGSMAGLQTPGARVLVSDSQDDARSLRLTLERVRVGRTWVGVNTMLPNRIVRAAVEGGRVAELAGYASLRAEVPYGTSSRIDLLLEAPGRPRCWVEVKNTTLRDGDVARFPDAVTERGRKHLGELERAVREGDRGVMFFLVNRGDCEAMGPADAVDPEYGKALRRAAGRGVELLAYRAVLRGASCAVGPRLPILL
jgi:sugar fermentation stimulation protein A